MRVPLKAATTFLTDNLGGKPLGCKLDVEGAEMDLLPALLRHSLCKYVFVEGLHRCSELFGLVADCRFDIYGVRRLTYSPRMQRLTGRAEMAGFHYFVAINPRHIHAQRTDAMV